MKTSVVILSCLLAVARAGNTFNCAKPNANFCLGGDIILRCDENGVGKPGRCSNNLAGYAPIGGPASCWQSSPEAGDAACLKNCIVHADKPFSLPGCSPTYTDSAPSSTRPPHPSYHNTTMTTVVTVPTTLPCKHCNSTQTNPGNPGGNPGNPGNPGPNPTSEPGSNPGGPGAPGPNPSTRPAPCFGPKCSGTGPFFPQTNGTTGPLPGTVPSTGFPVNPASPTHHPGKGKHVGIGGNNAGNNGNNGNDGSPTNVPVGPTTTLSDSTIPTSGAIANKAQLLLAAAGMVAAYAL